MNLMVALRKESVDRNFSAAYTIPLMAWSLSARRAWIEICNVNIHSHFLQVALRKESVDRNILAIRTPIGCVCRSPQGERG